MVVPFLVITRDFAPADMQYRMHRQHLWDEATGAFEHRSDVAHASAPLGVALATSSGWVAAGLARALRNGGSEIPTEMRLRWQRDAAAVIAACARHTRDDGCLPRVLTDSSSAVNSAAGLMLCYAVFTGIADGWLDESQAATAHQWLETSLTHLDALGWVEPDVAPEAAEDDDNGALSPAFALMAICARDRLVHH
jgi:unsaturated rhamnogalacturonyl hydrolase